MSFLTAPVGTDVELVFNCFERTVEAVTQTDVLADLAGRHGYTFARRTLLVNNLDAPERWRPALDHLVERGVVDRWVSVADALPDALRVVGLRRRNLRPREHWSDFALVAVTLPGPPLLCYCDPEITMPMPGDWITPALELMGKDSRVAVANPRWTTSSAPEEKADERSGEFLLGYGFTDHIFLVRRSEFARPIYRAALPIAVGSPASLRYPTAVDSSIFEMQVDAYMRTHRRMRAMHATICYDHAPPAGSNYEPRTALQKLRRLRNHAVLKVLVEARFSSPRLRLHGLLDEAPPAGPR